MCPNRQCQDCGGYELDNGVDDLCLCEEDECDFDDSSSLEEHRKGLCNPHQCKWCES